jgi:glycosyltransferase involved in cell wall biosynthesis
VAAVKLAICSLTGSPDDLGVWSGTPAHLLRAMRAQGETPTTVGPLSPQLYLAANALSGITGRLGRKVNWEVEPVALEHLTRQLRRAINKTSPDVVLLMGWYPWGLVPSDPPMVFWGDATIGQRVELAPHWSGLSHRTDRLVAKVEGEALRQLAGVLMSSNWALQDTIARYGLDPTRVHCVPFGANIDDPHTFPRQHPGSPPRILTVGVKWHRKGFDRAVQAADELHRAGSPVHLDVVGAEPPDATWSRPYVTYHGFLSKRNPAQLATLHRLYREADLFLLASRNDPFPMVLAEAAAYALPVVAADVGGVSDRVDKGGILLPEAATPQHYATAILAALGSEHYQRLSRGARRDFESRSSWDSSARLTLRLCKQLSY